MKEIFFFFGIFYLGFLIIFLLAYLIWPDSIVQDYPSHLDDLENDKIKKKFDEYKKSQDK